MSRSRAVLALQIADAVSPPAERRLANAGFAACFQDLVNVEMVTESERFLGCATVKCSLIRVEEKAASQSKKTHEFPTCSGCVIKGRLDGILKDQGWPRVLGTSDGSRDGHNRCKTAERRVNVRSLSGRLRVARQALDRPKHAFVRRRRRALGRRFSRHERGAGIYLRQWLDA
jgi:hypothetical protein